MTSHEGIPLSKISPAFLKANSTSHIWPFSAIAELIDNAYDPDVAAKSLHIDVKIIRDTTCLTFQDDGSGMDRDHLLKMLSFGFCEKDAYKTQLHHLPIGHYGNGFKSGSMRLAKDVIVFTVCKSSASVGFLSLSYLEERKLDSVIVPIVEYTLSDKQKITADNESSLKAILKYSLYSDEKKIQDEFLKLRQQSYGTGTLIVLYNLRKVVLRKKNSEQSLAKVAPEHGNGLHAVLSTRTKRRILSAGAESPQKRTNVTDGTSRSYKETSLNYNSATNLSNEGNASDVSASSNDLLAPPRSKQQRRSSEQSCSLLPTPKDPVIDLSNTDDESELAAQQCSATDNDAKPDIDVLKAAVMNYKDSLVNREVAVKSELTKEVGVQVSIKEEETKHMLLKQKHAVLQQHFEKFQHDVFTLLTFLLDDTDIGQEEDIEIAVVELIRANRADGQ